MVREMGGGREFEREREREKKKRERENVSGATHDMNADALYYYF